MKHDADTEALEKICGDMDDMESSKMFKKPESDAEGVSITVSVKPKADEPKEEKVEPISDDDDSKLPPFLRKKK